MKYNSANMNTLIKSCLTLCLLWSAIGSHAQVIKKSDTDDSKKTSNQLSVRAQSLYDTQDASDADIPWMRVIYRQIDLNKEKNMPLYYPEESTENQENLFRIVMKLLANNQIPAYEYLDGREIFTDEYRIKVKEMFDRFHILYAPAKGYSEKNPRFTVEESDIPSNEVLSYYILEKWIFDRRTSQVKPSIEAICPVLHRTGDFGGEAVKYPMFWVKQRHTPLHRTPIHLGEQRKQRTAIQLRRLLPNANVRRGNLQNPKPAEPVAHANVSQ